MTEDQLRQAIRDTCCIPEWGEVRAIAIAGGFKDLERASVICQEEWNRYKSTPAATKNLKNSARVKLYLSIPLTFVPVIGMIVIGAAIADEADSKGYSRNYGILGALGFIGAVVIAIMPDKSAAKLGA